MKSWRKRPRRRKWIVSLKNGPYEECETLRKDAIQAVRDAGTPNADVVDVVKCYDRAIRGFMELEEFCRLAGDRVGEQGYRDLREECERRKEQSDA